MPRFKRGDARTRELARRGGSVRAAQRRSATGPYTGTILDVMDLAGLTGSDWLPWRAWWKAVFGLPMDAAELAIYERHTERSTPPTSPVREGWLMIGRRGGKSRNAAVAALYLAIRFDASVLAPGESAIVPVIAADRKQARQVLGYLKGLLALPEFKPYLHRSLKETVELHNSINIEIHTASFRSVRGYTVIGAIADEVAFWMNDDRSANPDSEIMAALRPGMATVPNALLLGLSSPYAAKGELHAAVQRSFGKDDGHTLIWNADTGSMNPSVPAYIIDRAFEEDPVSAASEYGRDGRVVFRRDVESFLDAAAVAAVTVQGRLELPPRPGVRYTAFVDPSGGSQDSFTLAVAHLEGEVAVLDAIRERRPPFSPDSVVAELAELVRSYNCREVVGDRYGGEWPREAFARYGVTYKPSEQTKSDLYRELVAPTNSGKVELLDLPVLRAQLLGLERRVARGGKDSVDHGPGGRDDVANAVAGALVNVLPRVGTGRRVQWA